MAIKDSSFFFFQINTFSSPINVTNEAIDGRDIRLAATRTAVAKNKTKPIPKQIQAKIRSKTLIIKSYFRIYNTLTSNGYARHWKVIGINMSIKLQTVQHLGTRLLFGN